MEMAPIRLDTGYDPTDWAWKRHMVEWLLGQQMTGSVMLPSLSVGAAAADVEKDWAKNKLKKSLVEGVTSEMVKQYPDIKRAEGINLVHLKDFRISFEVEEHTDTVPGQGQESDIQVKTRVMRMRALWLPKANPLMMSADGDRYWILDRMIDASERHIDIEVHHANRYGSLDWVVDGQERRIESRHSGRYQDRDVEGKTSRYIMVGWLSDQHRWLYQEVREVKAPSEPQPEQDES